MLRAFRPAYTADLLAAVVSDRLRPADIQIPDTQMYREPAAVNGNRFGFKLSGLRLDTFGAPLTDSWFPGGDGEKRPPVTAAGARTWPAMANAETNGETENVRNVGQLRTSGTGYAVNKLRGKPCGERNWLLR